MTINKANRAMAKAPGKMTGGEREAVVEVLETGGQVGARLVQRSMRRIEAAQNAALGDTEQKIVTRMMMRKLLGPIDFAKAIVTMKEGQNKSPSLATCRKWIKILKLARQAGGCPEGGVGAELEELLGRAEDKDTCGVQAAFLISEYCSMVAKDEQQECLEKIKGKVRGADAERGRESNRGSKRGRHTTTPLSSPRSRDATWTPTSSSSLANVRCHATTGRSTSAPSESVSTRSARRARLATAAGSGMTRKSAQRRRQKMRTATARANRSKALQLTSGPRNR